ncbi:MAG: DUF262 domain-containing protein [Candidatus Omnitrophica bacterium]|nr:DUF262 domain-containing protein [Candidatus Omnitrophota bacterium]
MKKTNKVFSDQKEEELVVDEVMNEDESYVTYDIASYPSDLTLSGINEMWNNKDIVIPEFQRNFVWNIQQASLLIESFLLGLPVPQVFFYVDEQNKSQVIDGQQRIMSVVYFLEGYFGSPNLQEKRQVFRLHGLDEKSPFAKKRFVDLEETWQRKLKSAVLRAINIRQLNPKGQATSIYHIFERLNTGGTPLKPQEIRNCVFRGEIVRILKELNEDKNWRELIGKKLPDRHQKDVELILRILSLSHVWREYEKPMKEFINKTMDKERTGSSQRIKKFVNDFPKTTEIILEKFDLKPFHVRGPLNTSALDSIFCTILDNLNKLPDDLSDRYKKLLKDDQFIQATYYSTSDPVVVKQRFEKAHEYLIA